MAHHTIDTIVINAHRVQATPDQHSGPTHLMMTETKDGKRLVLEFDEHPRLLRRWGTTGGVTNKPARIVYEDRKGWPTATLVSITPIEEKLEGGS